jgi:hypothetical protein
MDLSQIQHGNVQIQGLMSNPEFADLLGEEFRQQHVKYKPEDDAKLIVRFYSAAVLLSHASEQLKKPKIIQSDFVAIRLDEYSEHITEVGYKRDAFGKVEEVAGMKIPHPKREEYIQRFPKAWEAYQRQYERSEGTPLNQLKGITLTEIAQLGFYKIRTIEALADSTDRLYIPSGSNPPFLDDREGGGSYIELREEARRFIKENGEFEAVVQAKAEAQAEAAALREVVARLQAELAATGPTASEQIAIHNDQLIRDSKQEAIAKAERRK